MFDCVCHTAGCGNDGAVITLQLTGVDDDGNTWEVSSVTCGACGQPITDVEPAAAP